jgi:hypothetical protein
MEQVTVILNNRDLLHWPSAMCQKISEMAGLYEIIILDNGSTNVELLQWYKSCPYTVLFLKNLGHRAPWDSGLLAHIKTDLYVVSDTDLDLSQLPDDTLLHLARLLEKYPSVGKVGLSLRTDCVDPKSPYYEHVKNYEAGRQRGVQNEEFYAAPVDTTFAIYNRKLLSEYRVCGIRAIAPYCARHIPWEISDPQGDFKYYLERCNESSSYKLFTKFSSDSEAMSRLYARRTTGKVSTKWSSYFHIYDFWLAGLRGDSLNILEIGVQNGGSLELLSQYFRNANSIVGVDINPLVNTLLFDDPRIKVLFGAAREERTFNELCAATPDGYDLIIDDGSHHSLDTVMNFVMYFPRLKAGGLYLVEDMHCAYWDEYGGGQDNPRSASAFFKLLADSVNMQHSRGKFSSFSIFKDFFQEVNFPTCLVDDSIYSISFYNSMYVIQKSSPGKGPYLGDCVIVGDEAKVDDRVLGHRITSGSAAALTAVQD